MDYREFDIKMMQRALRLAEKGQGLVEPNPMVGCVICKDGVVIGEGCHERFGRAHAEVNAVASAGASARGATAYVTLEPCAHFGKTPPCAPVLVRAGIKRVFVGAKDPNPITLGKGIRHLMQNGVEVITGLCKDKCVLLNAPFFKLIALKAPLVTAKWAMTLDGRIAAQDGSSKWISSTASRRMVHELRGRVDAVVVGIGTVLADNPRLTCRDAKLRRTATRIVLDSKARTPSSSALAQTAHEVPVIVAATDAAPEQSVTKLRQLGCEVLTLPPGPDGQVDARALLAELGQREMSNILLEGGSRVLGTFFDMGLIDRVMAFVAPRLIGHAGALSPLAGAEFRTMSESMKLQNVHIENVGGDVIIDGWLSDPGKWAQC